MKSYKFEIKADLVINAESREQAEQYLRECLNPNGEMFNIEADGTELPNGLDYLKGDVFEEYAVNFK